MLLLTRKQFRVSALVSSCIAGVFLCHLVLQESYLFGPEVSSLNRKCEENGTLTETVLDPLHPLTSLNGPPTLSYKDNLRNQTRYISSWGGDAGWTNDVISFIHLIYLGLITDRVSIVPMHTSTHLPGNSPSFNFGDAFDVPRLRTTLGKPVLEWREVKMSDSPIVDDIGCWNVWGSVQDMDKFPRRGVVPAKLNLDISYTKTPPWIKLSDTTASFWSLAALSFPEAHAANLVAPLPSSQHHLSLPPDEHLLCYDFLYYVAALQPYEIGLDYSPAWRYVGQHMRWTATLEQLADEYVRQALGVVANDPTPPFISVHVRRDDFKGWCAPGLSIEECFAPLDAFTRRVEEVKAEVWQRKGIAVNHVIVTSDETDTAWWDQVTAVGWLTLDHSQTQETHGIWYPALIDAVIQSGGVGFVGTSGSTMSLLAARRVESWRDGAVRLVKWGRPGADGN
ncbi:hypothetical protein C8R44DRAFT_756982 [Mycena epipterygia]|nr:hypothetical protein C8R44DRAFT_756982 [Mycena epipterygia]